MKLNVLDFVIMVVVVVWAGCIGYNMYDRTYPIPNTVIVAFGAVAAFLFGNKVLKGGK